MMIETLYRLFDKTNNRFVGTVRTGSTFYDSLKGAKLGIHHHNSRYSWDTTPEYKFEIQEWVALPKTEYEKLLNVQSKHKCVLCDKKAITTAAHIPVCEEHYDQYAEEGRQYLPYRPFYEKLQRAYEQRGK